MTDVNGSANGAGNPPGDGGNGGGNGGGEKPWYAGVQNEELRGKAELKGWKSPDDALSSYFNLESKLGAPPDRLLKLPEKPDDPAWQEIHKKLGFAAPESPDEYELPVPEGFSDDYAKAIAAKAKELGVPKHMLKGLSEFNNEFVKTALDAQEKAAKEAHDAALAKLRVDWGGNYEPSMALAQRAEEQVMSEIGLSSEAIDAWRGADPGGYYKLLAYMGSKMGEARRIEGSGSAESAVAMSPEAARAKLSQLMGDKDWFKRWDAGDHNARTEFSRLNQIIAASKGG